MIHKILNEQSTEYLMETKQRHQREQEKVQESELYDVDFTVYLDKNIFQILGIVFLFVLLLFIKTFARQFYQLIVRRQIPDFGTVTFVLFAVGAVFFVAIIVWCLWLWLRPKPHIVRNQLQYRGKVYHYSEITGIHINSIQSASVYVEGRKLFTVTGDYVNYGTLIAWAEKCRIPIQQKKSQEISPEQIKKITERIMVIVMITVIVMVFLMLFAAIFPLRL